MTKPETNNIIVLEQAPVIRYSIIEQKGREIEQRIASLNLEQIEPSEANLKLMKSTRSELGREFKTFEEQRKMVKDLIMRPYLEFEAKYKEFIAERFKEADALLKEKITVVDDAILTEKIERIKAYFDEKNEFDFISFDDLELKILKSKSDKFYKDQIDEFLAKVASDIEAIEMMDNSERIMAKYRLYKDLNLAVTQTQLEIKQEQEMAQRKAEQERLKAEALERQRQEQEAQKAQEEAYVEQMMPESQTPPQEPQPEQPKLYRTRFTVTATKEQIAALKEFMNKEGIRYE